ncbi:Ig-like domain-containing protein [Campylobacter concisus]|uniref:Ig-like domain-containing protein n=1 Tax=Campylobacter concisus TaxID=199 RepID=UPI003D246F27
MAKKLGTIKSISGSAEVIAVDKSGNQRVLKVGDSLYEGESVKTTSADSKVVIATNNGKELSMIGEDTLTLDPKATAGDTQVAALQKALLNGANLEDLEETAAGGTSGGRAGDGMSLGETRFEHGGHYSNVSTSTSAINPLGAFGFASPETGVRGGLDNGGTGGGTGFYIDTTPPKVTVKSVTPVDTNSPADGNPNKATVTGESDEPNAPVVIKDKDNNVIGEGKTDNDGKFVIDTTKPVNPSDKVTVEITDNAGNTGKGEGTAGNTIYTDTTAPSEPTITFDEDIKPKDGKLNKDENSKDGDNANTTAKISIPADAVVGDVIKYTVNGGTEQSHPITDADKAAGHVEVKVPVTDGQTSSVTAKIVDQAGNVGKEAKESLDVDTKAPTVENVKVTPVDTNSPADGNPNKATVTGESDEPNAPVVIKDKDNNVIGEGKTDNDGKFVIDTTKPVNPSDKVTVEITDNAGNTGKGEGTAGNTIYTDTTAPSEPTITFDEDIKPKDGKLNKDENSKDGDNANTTAKISIPADAVVGDVIKYTVNGGTEQSHPITDADKAAGHVEVKVPVTDGQTSSVTAKIVDQAGNVGKEAKESLDVDTKAPTVENVKVTPVDTNSPADGNPNKATVTGESDEPNAPVVIKDKDNNVIGEGKTDNDGKFVIDTTKPVNPSDKVTVEITDNAGNTGKGEGTAGNTIYTDTTAPSEPTITFDEDIKPKDGKLNKDENSKDGDNANTTAKISIPADAVVGDVIKYTVNGGTEQSHPITDADKAAGHVEVKVPVTDGQTSSVTAKIVDQAGNVGKEAKESLDVDTKAPTVENVKVTPVDTNSPADGNPNKATVTGESDEPNAPVVIKDKDNNVIGEGKTDNDGKFVIDTTKPVNPSDKVTVEITDNAGNTGKGEGTAGNTIYTDTTAPSEPTITFDEDIKPKDGKLNKDENSKDGDNANTTAKISIPADAVVGDVIKYTVNGGTEQSHPITDADKAAGHVEVKVPVTDGQTSSVTAKIVDQAGNVGKEAKESLDVDTKAPTVENVKVTPVDTNSPADGNPNKATVTGESDEPNAPVVIKDKDNNVIGEGKTDNDGKFVIDTTKPVNPSDKVTVEITDNAGNTGKGEGTAGNTIYTDTTAPSEPTITFDEDIKPKDGKLNKDENSKDGDNANTTAKISIPADAVVGDVIKYTVNGGTEQSHPITDADKAAGHVEVKVPVTDGQTSSVTAKIVDQAGNVGKEAKESLDVDTKAPTVENVKVTPVDTNSPADGNPNKATVTGESDEPNAPVVIKDKDNNVIGEGKTDNDGKFVIDTTKPVNPSDKVTVEITDNAGNTGKGEGTAGNTIYTDTTAPSEPTITFDEDIKPKDGKLNKDENSKDGDNANTTAKISIPADAVVGDVIKYTVNGGTEQSHPITDADKAAGHVEVKVPVTDGQTSSVTAKIVDQAGNVGKEAKESLDVDLTDPETIRKPSDPSITFPEDNDPKDGKISDKENKAGDKDAGKTTSEVIIPQDGSVKPGDKLVVTDENGKQTEKTIEQGDIDNGSIKVPVDLNPGKDNTITAEIINPNNPNNPGKDSKVIGEDSENTKAPEAPVINEVIDDVKGGKFNEDIKGGLTNDSTPTIKGTAKAGSKVIIYDNGVEIGRIEKADANWEFTTPELTKQGEHKFTAIAKNEFGESGSSNEVTIDLDTKAPVIDRITITPVDTSNPADSTAELTNVTGHTDTPKADLVFKDASGKVIGSGKANNTGGFLITDVEGVKPGDKITVEATDKAGNTSVTEVTAGEMIHPNDHTAPSEPTITFDEDIKPKDGKLNKDENSKDGDNANTTAKISIPADAVVGDVIKYTVNGGTEQSHPITDADKAAGHVEVKVPVTDGQTSSVTAKIVDQAGNVGKEAKESLDVDLTDPETIRKPSDPSITFPEDNDPKDGKISDKENKAGDKDAGKTTSEVIIPQDGSVKPGDKLVVTDENGKQTEKTIEQGDIDNGSIKVPVDLNPGKDNTITAEIINPNNPNNPGKDSKVIGEDSENTKAPEAPVINEVIDDVKGGKFNEDIKGGLTNDSTPTIKGTAKAGSKVIIYDNGVEIGRIEKADANWEFTTPELTKQGEHKFTAIAKNEFGESGSSNEVTIDLDTKAPVIDRITITPVDTSNPADSTAELTNVTGHTDTPKADLVFKDASGKVIGSGKANNTGGFLITDVEGVKPGDKITVEATDKAGNTSVTEVTAGEMIHPNDHTAPSEPTITFDEDIKPKDGKLNKDENSKDGDNANTTAKISIPADAVVGDVIKYTVNGGTEQSHPITDADKAAGHVEVKVPVTDGQTSSVTAKIVDQAGNASEAVTSSIDVDLTSMTPTIDQVTDNQYGGIQDGNNVLGIDDGLTNDSTPTFKGTAEPGATIVLKNGNDIISKDIIIKADANGNWEFTPKTALADGEYNVTAIATDKAGNVSDPSNVATINIDTNCPKPVITEIVDNVAGGVVNGDVKNGLTNDSTPTLKGTAEPGSTVKVWIDGLTKASLVNGEVIYDWTTTTKGDGTWEFILPKLEDGRHLFVVKATDKAGTNSPDSDTVGVTVDTTAGAPKVMITADKDDNSILTATEASSITDGKLKWVIKLPEDAKVGDRIEVANSHREWVTILTLSAADIAKGEVARDDFSADFVKGKSGFETPSYRIVDQAGNVSTEHWDTVKFDKAAPTAPVIKEVIDDHKGYDDDTRVGDVLKVEGGLTNDNTPTIKGTAEAGIKVDIYDNGKWIGDTKADTNGNWEFTPEISAVLPDGKHSITAVAKNALDVESAPSNAANIDVDTVTPKPTIDKITDNVEGGVYHGDVKGGLTNDNRPVFEGSAEKGAFIELFDNGKVIGTTKAGEDGKWTIQPKEPMADGKHNMVVQATDLAGNRSRSDQTSSDVDTTPGVVKITAVCDDVAGYNGKVGNILGVNNGLTNDSTPTIKGTAKPGTTITIKDGNSVIDGVIKYNGDGSWEFTPKTPFADGEHKLTAIATSRTSGAQSVSNVATIDVDTTIRIELTEVTPIAEGTTPGAHISTPTINFNTISGGNYVSQGDKSDYVKVNNLVSNCAKIDLGNGNDTLAIGGLVKNGVVINAGRGNDKITIGEYLKGSLVNLGEGGANIVRTRIAGISDEINAAFIIKDKNGLKIGDGKTDADGKFDMFIDKAIKPGEKLSVEIVDAAGNKASDSKAASHIEVSGVRYYDNELDVGTNIHAATVLAGNGNDLVVVGEKGKPDGYITANSKIDLGEGDNEIRVRTNIDHSEIKTGSGDDIVTTGLKGNGFGYITNESKIDLGDGNNKLTVGTNIDHSEIKTGSGDDIVTTGLKGNGFGYITNESKIDLGDGNNKLTVGTNIQNSEIKTGSGDDVVNVGVNGIGGYIRGHSIVELGAGNDLLNVRTYIDHSTVDTGAGNDVVKVGSYIHSSKVDLGAGDDTLSIGKVDLNNSKVDGGAGYDKLVLENPDKSVNLSDISKFAKNFEELDISGAKNTTLKVGIKDVLDMTDDKNTLKITGDKGDTVDLKGNGWHQGASEDGYTTYTNNTVTIQIKDEIHVI